jgi:hypothetical protein
MIFHIVEGSSLSYKVSHEKQSSQAIATIENLIIPELERLKLKTIANKIHHSVSLSWEENICKNSFSNSEKSYILTGD